MIYDLRFTIYDLRFTIYDLWPVLGRLRPIRAQLTLRVSGEDSFNQATLLDL